MQWKLRINRELFLATSYFGTNLYISHFREENAVLL